MICPVCKSHRLHLIEARGRRKELAFDSNDHVSVQYYSCKQCGTVRKWPVPSEETLRRYYENAWQAETDRPHACLMQAALWIEHHWRPHASRTGFHSAADIGAKNTSLLGVIGTRIPIKELHAADPYDSEPTWLGDGDHLSVPDVYDLVTCTHVMEHVANVDLFLAQLAQRVRLNGCLYIEVPALEGDDYATENIHRAHLWHFPLHALVYLATHGTLASFGMTVIAAQTDRGVKGWPVNRLLLRRSDSLLHIQGGNMSHLWLRQEQRQEDAYVNALARLKEHPPDEAVLYGACETLLQLAHYGAERGPRLGGYRLADAYKTGKFLEWPIEQPADMLDTFKAALVTTRNWTSIQAIKAFLKERHPNVRAVPLF